MWRQPPRLSKPGRSPAPPKPPPPPCLPERSKPIRKANRFAESKIPYPRATHKPGKAFQRMLPTQQLQVPNGTCYLVGNDSARFLPAKNSSLYFRQRNRLSFGQISESVASSGCPKKMKMLMSAPIAMPTSQLALSFPSQFPADTLGVTFRDSKRRAFHRWYPYVQGFSADYVREVLARFGPTLHIYDPFGGAGTTQLEASIQGIASSYSEINPFMRFVAETKINSSIWARRNSLLFEETCRQYLRRLEGRTLKQHARRLSLKKYDQAFGGRDFFEEEHLRDLLAARELAIEMAGNSAESKSLLLLAVATNVVQASNMTRRADLRRRRPDEYKNRVVDVIGAVTRTVTEMLHDIASPHGPQVATECACESAKDIGNQVSEIYDLSVTSPPYLNGTNYCRNTKLELWFLGWLEDEDGLRKFRDTAIAAGINNVTKGRKPLTCFDSVEAVATRLDTAAEDKRIPALVRSYFSDMSSVFAAVQIALKPGARFVVDIGDSRFYGIPVPTDSLLLEVAEKVGLRVESQRLLAHRYSYDKTELKQVELVLRKPTPSRPRASRMPSAQTAIGDIAQHRAESRAGVGDLAGAIEAFRSDLPYKCAPYQSRNWGHRLHSLCSYQGKLKPAIAHWLVRIFSKPGMKVLDPLGGVGTVAFEACCQGRIGITNDLSPLAYSVASGKVCAPTLAEAEREIHALAQGVASIKLGDEDHRAADFGLNGKVPDYYHTRTLEEVLKARRYFLGLESPSDAALFVKASLLHVLHGNRPYALSRTSHPITPFHPSGPAKYKSLVKHVTERVGAALAAPLPEAFVSGASVHGDFRKLISKVGKVDRIITSPPFLGMRFDRPNWLRMWFCGWNEEDFHHKSRAFLERQQIQSLSVYRDFYSACSQMLNRAGLMVVHIGGSEEHEMVQKLVELGTESMELLGVVEEDVSGGEHHGIKDKGLTTTHNYIFLLNR
jgi:DNA modification methylase